MLVSYFINNKLFAQKNFKPGQYRSHSHIYLCPTCGEVWARVFVHDEKTEWGCLSIPCEKHSRGPIFDTITPPGSLAMYKYHGEAHHDGVRPICLYDFPNELLAREFLLLCKVKGVV